MQRKTNEKIRSEISPMKQQKNLLKSHKNWTYLYHKKLLAKWDLHKKAYSID